MPPREVSRRLAFALHRLERAGVRVDAILRQQGEFEAGREGVTESYWHDSYLQVRDFIRRHRYTSRCLKMHSADEQVLRRYYSRLEKLNARAGEQK